MKGKITNIINGENPDWGKYKRLQFILENGKFAQTDVVQKFKNAELWKEFLEVGTILGGLTPMSNNPEKLNADFRPYRTHSFNVVDEDKQLDLF